MEAWSSEICLGKRICKETRNIVTRYLTVSVLHVIADRLDQHKCKDYNN